MNQAAIEPEVLPPEEERQLLAVVQENGIQPDTAKSLQASFAPLFAEVRGVLEKSKIIQVTDASQKLEIKLARECRLALRVIRVNGDKVRKSLKEESLRRGKAIDGFFNILLHLTEAEERRLEEQEKFVERQDEQRRAQLRMEREKALEPYGIDTTFYNLSAMSDDAWAQLLENTRAAHEAKLERERRAEEERIRIEHERLKEQQRIREENERLKKEAEERERVAQAERKKRQQLHEERRKVIEPYIFTGDASGEIHFGDLTEEQFSTLCAEAKERRVKREAAAEFARKERARLEEELRKSAEAEKQAQAEREKIERKAEEDRQARKRLEAEKRDRELAEEKKRKSEQAAARKAAVAPERTKLLAYAKTLRTVNVPVLTSDGGQIVVEEIGTRVEKLAAWIEQEAERL